MAGNRNIKILITNSSNNYDIPAKKLGIICRKTVNCIIQIALENTYEPLVEESLLGKVSSCDWSKITKIMVQI